jgi:glutaredoxin 3
MSSSVKLTLYTQNDCPYCVMMKNKLKEWGYDYTEVNISYELDKKAFLRENGHRTVPQVYWNNTHLNKVDTAELTQKMLEAELDYDNYVGGVESFR